jgi:KamA family protein
LEAGKKSHTLLGAFVLEAYQRQKERILSLIGASDPDWADWRWHVSGLGSAEVLSQFLKLSRAEREGLELYAGKVRATPHFLALADPAEPACPIRRQVIPRVERLPQAQSPLQEGMEEERPAPLVELLGPGRARLALAPTGPAQCLCSISSEEREEKRQEPTPEAMEEALKWLRSSKGVREVVIGGGEPLVMENHQLEAALGTLYSCPHIVAVRLNTRALSHMPQRFDKGLCSLLGRFGPLYLQSQFNHPLEVTDESAEAAYRLARSGVVVQNGALLLRGVNDRADVISELHRALLKIKVRPAFLLSPSSSTIPAHLRVDTEKGPEIIRHLRSSISGLAVPRHISYP